MKIRKYLDQLPSKINVPAEGGGFTTLHRLDTDSFNWAVADVKDATQKGFLSEKEQQDRLKSIKTAKTKKYFVFYRTPRPAIIINTVLFAHNNLISLKRNIKKFCQM